MVGNAAAALHGAPVTTIDIDFLFRDTRGNREKLKRLAAAAEAVIFRPVYPAAGLFRLQRDSDGLQLDFMTSMAGGRSFESIRSRATAVEFGAHTILVACLADIIASKTAANRPKDRAVMDVLKQTAKRQKENGEKDQG